MEKTKPKPSQIEKTEKTEQNQKNRVNLVFVLKNRTETGRFELVSISFKKKFNLIIFFNKNRTEPKIINPNINFAGKTFTLAIFKIQLYGMSPIQTLLLD